MFPLFSRECELVGWAQPNRHIFDADMNWVAYISAGQAWSAETGNWLGPINGLLCLDRSGRPVAWNPTEVLMGIARPAIPGRAALAAMPPRPSKPALPARPARPAAPSGGWSTGSFYAWLSQ